RLRPRLRQSLPLPSRHRWHLPRNRRTRTQSSRRQRPDHRIPPQNPSANPQPHRPIRQSQARAFGRGPQISPGADHMRIGLVIGRICLQPLYETLVGGRFLLVQVMDRFALAGGTRKSNESLIVYDHLGAGDGDLIAFTESREAAMPFYPEKRVPLDAYNAAILDAAVIELQLDKEPATANAK